MSSSAEAAVPIEFTEQAAKKVSQLIAEEENPN